jgi:hypothetical protein
MLRASWSAASTLLLALCTFGNTSVEACDWGCAGCAGYGYGYGGYGGYGYGGYGYGGYGYTAAAYAYSPYSAYANYAPPVYYQPVDAYYAPQPYYGYAAPAYGAGYGYGASNYAPGYGRPYYLGAANGHAPTITGRAPAMLATAQGGKHAPAPRMWPSKTPLVTTATTASPQAKFPAKRPLGFSAIAAQPRPAMRNTEKNTEKSTQRGTRKMHGPTLTASGTAPAIRRADAGITR